MKQIIALLVFSLFALNVQAQTITPSNSGDSLIDADTVDLEQRVRGEWSTVSFQATVTKSTGTVAGDVKFQGSLDGSSWVDISSDTLTDSSTNTFIYSDTDAAYLWYRVRLISSGTMEATTSGKVFRRKKER